MIERLNEEPKISVQELKNRIFLVTVKADNRNKNNPQVLYQYAEMLIPAPDMQCAMDIAREQFGDFDIFEITKLELVENNGQRTKDA